MNTFATDCIFDIYVKVTLKSNVTFTFDLMLLQGVIIIQIFI